MNLPNALTLLRILLVPVYLFFFYSKLKNNILLAGAVFIMAGISDVLDGYIARKHNLSTKVGIVLDPIADKLMTFTILISFVTKGIIPLGILLAIGIKECLMILGGVILYFFRGKQVLPSNKYGKIATFSFYTAALSVVFKLPVVVSRTLFIITVALNIIAFINYLIIFMNMSNNKINEEVDK